MSADDIIARIRAIRVDREAMSDEEREAEEDHMRELLWDDARLAAADAEADR